MYFCTWFGQMRPKPKDKGRGWEFIPGDWYFRPKRPIGRIQLKDLAPPGVEKHRQNVEYRANENGCMFIQAHEHIKDMVALGYPIWDGVTKFQLPEMVYMDVKREGLIWPDNTEYDRRIMEGLNKRGR